MDKFLEPYNLPTLNYDEIENLHRLITNKEIESVVKSLPAPPKKSSGLDGFTDKFHQIFKELTPALNFSSKWKKRE